jgi:hypothetical protein
MVTRLLYESFLQPGRGVVSPAGMYLLRNPRNLRLKPFLFEFDEEILLEIHCYYNLCGITLD